MQHLQTLGWVGAGKRKGKGKVVKGSERRRQTKCTSRKLFNASLDIRIAMLRTVAEHVDVADTETVSSRCPRIASVAYQRTREQQTNKKYQPRSAFVFFSILQIMDLVLQVAKVGTAI